MNYNTWHPSDCRVHKLDSEDACNCEAKKAKEESKCAWGHGWLTTGYCVTCKEYLNSPDRFEVMI